jgi:hypothetical protein
VLGSLAGPQHRARDVRGKHSLEVFPIEIHETFEYTNPRMVHRNIEIAELLEDVSWKDLAR